MSRVRMLGFSAAAAVVFVVIALFYPMVSPASAFSDVTAGRACVPAIVELSSRGIISGYTNGEFGIDDPASRQQFAKMMIKTLGLPVTEGELCPFTDVATQTGSDPLYPSKYVAACALEGITAGTTAVTFAPHANITRQQLYTMVTRAMRFLDPPSDYAAPFAEEQFSLKDHYENARKAAYVGLLEGLEGMGSACDFQAEATRGECAQLLYNLLPQAAVTAPNADAIESVQFVVDAMAGLQLGSIPDHFMDGHTARREGDFDVNTYLEVLHHLSVERGYVLDYVYQDGGIGGSPVIYARPVAQPAYASFEDWAAAAKEGDFGTGYADHSKDYLAHVQADGTREGYLQMGILRMMGDRFYLFWHANYNDQAIICDSEALGRVLADADEFPGEGQPSLAWVRRQATRIDLRPVVRLLGDGTAVVRFVTFSKWGGLMEVSYTMGQAFPHQSWDWDTDTLVEYDCRLRF